MKYIIVGGGPSGLSLAHGLIQGGHDVDIIEKNTQLGGSWNSQWIEQKYWSENSPRILIYGSPNLKSFLNDIGINKEHVSVVYGNYMQLLFKTMRTSLTYLNFFDIIKITSKITSEKLTSDKHTTVQDWLDKSTLSKDGKKYIKMTSILLNDRPDKTNLKDYINAISGFLPSAVPYQFKDPNDWHRKIENNIKNISSSNVYKNTEVVSLIENNNRVTGIIMKDLNTNKITINDAERVILCCQPTGILNILQMSNDKIKNNWKDFKSMKHWCDNTYYSGFGFQLQFDEIVEFPSFWCWSCAGDWNVIILPVSNWLDNPSKDNKIKTVWSCCIVDMDTKSKRLNKTANECTKSEVLNECLNQINEVHKIPKPYRITFSVGLKHYLGKWQSMNVGFTRNKLGFLPMKGTIDNLFALGCFTETKNSIVAHMGGAVDASAKFLNEYEPSIESFHNKSSMINMLINILIFFIILVIVTFLIRKKYINPLNLSSKIK